MSAVGVASWCPGANPSAHDAHSPPGRGGRTSRGGNAEGAEAERAHGTSSQVLGAARAADRAGSDGWSCAGGSAHGGGSREQPTDRMRSAAPTAGAREKETTGARLAAAFIGLERRCKVSGMAPFAMRRQRVLDAIDGVAVVAAAPVTIRNNDVEHDYRQDSDFHYLTGFDEPEAVLVLSTVHEAHRAVLFVRDRDAEREVWDGARVGVEDASARFGVDATFPIGALGKELPKYLEGAPHLYFDLERSPAMTRRVFAALKQARQRGRNAKGWPRSVVSPEAVWHEMRLIKDEHERATMREAASITAEAHLAAMKTAAPGRFEYEVEAALREVFHRRGSARAAYRPIVGSGPNATVLHYRANRRQMHAGELLLIDAGCEFAYYAADVTRTFPVDGRFRGPQRDLYEVVLAAQEAALDAIAKDRTTTDLEQIYELIRRRLTEGMIALGLLEGEVDARIEDDSYKRFFMHRTSHWIGMDVHDVGAYFVDGAPQALRPGMVLTVEPGLYIHADDEEAPPAFRGLGVRIEDDILITADGVENLTAAIPKTIEDVEAACR